LKQLLPEVARSYREQHASILRRAALVQRLAVGRPAAGRGALKAAGLEREVEAVRGAVATAIRAHASVASFRYAQAADLLLTVFGRTRDSTYLRPALAVLDYMIDSGDAAAAVGARDDPPDLVRAGLLRDLAAGWSAASDPRYRDAAGILAQRLAGDVGRTSDRTVYADRDAYVIGSILAAGARDRRRAIPTAGRGDTRDVRRCGGRRRAAGVHLSGGGARLPAGPLIEFPSATVRDVSAAGALPRAGASVTP